LKERAESDGREGTKKRGQERFQREKEENRRKRDLRESKSDTERSSLPSASIC